TDQDLPPRHILLGIACARAHGSSTSTQDGTTGTGRAIASFTPVAGGGADEVVVLDPLIQALHEQAGMDVHQRQGCAPRIDIRLSEGKGAGADQIEAGGDTAARGAGRNGYAGRGERVARVVIADTGRNPEPVVLAGITQHYAPV